MRSGPLKHSGLILSGGGARAAYQVGVLRALAESLPDDYPLPFDIICGTSAGALNAAGLATHANCLQEGVTMMESIWGKFRTDEVYRTDWPGVLARAWRFLWTMAFGRLRHDLPISLLDNSPLRALLDRSLALPKIQEAIAAGHLHAICITASGYSSGQSVSFFQGIAGLETWQRSRRLSVREDITLDHLMASAAIPIIFPAVHVHREYFGDGALHQLSPISPALHLGAERVVVIGVSGQSDIYKREKTIVYPSIAQVVSHIMSSCFIDSLEADIERLIRINRTLKMIPEEVRKQESILRNVDIMVISPPAQVLDMIALRHADLLPKSIRMFLRGSGATHKSGSGVLSYLLFEAAYCQDLMALGYNDGLGRRDEIKRFLGIDEDTASPQKTESNVPDLKQSD